LLSADLWSLIATVLRNIILNWFVLIPVFLAALAVPRTVASAVWASWRGGAPVLIALGFISCTWTIAYVSRKRIVRVEARPDQTRVLRLALAPLCLASLLLSIGWAWWHLASEGKMNESIVEDMTRFVLFGISVMFTGWLAYTLSVSISPGAVDPELKPSAGERVWEALSYILTGAIGGVILVLAGHAFDGHPIPCDGEDVISLLYATIAPPLFILSFTLAATFFVGLASDFMSEDDREWWSRFGAWALIAATTWTVAGMVVLLLPQWIGDAKQLATAGAATLGSGALTILGGLSRSTIFKPQPDDPKKPRRRNRVLARGVRIALPIFIVLFAVFLSLATDIVVAISSGRWIDAPTFASQFFDANLHYQLAHDPLNVLVIVAAAALGLLSSRYVGINLFSLHAMYRNRLVRAYLGASRGQAGVSTGNVRRPDKFIGFDRDDDLRLCESAPPGPRKLLHVINMALNLVGGSELAWQERKAESMTATSLHVGTYSLGYRRASEYGGQTDANGKGHPLTLGTAMAISGAAASPNMGYHSSPVLTFLMTLFNARLGWWLGNPGAYGERSYYRESPKWALQPLIAEAFGITDERHPYVYVSDGGHFENLGLYEMVRRRCRFILVVDAGADPDIGYQDLSAAIRKIRSDLGISIDVPPKSERLIYARPADKPDLGRMALLGDINYADVDSSAAEKGVLVYVKPAFYDAHEPLDVVHYATANAAFPHETTADQFFSESQFESYRALGLFAVRKMTAHMKTATLEDFRQSVREYLA
jgi:hypothetical protein